MAEAHHDESTPRDPHWATRLRRGDAVVLVVRDTGQGRHAFVTGRGGVTPEEAQDLLIDTVAGFEGAKNAARAQGLIE